MRGQRTGHGDDRGAPPLTGAGGTVPTTPKGLRTRAAILDAARAVFASSGYHEARMADVAAAAGVSNGALYRYFTSKDEVFAAVIADLHEALFTLSGTDQELAAQPLDVLREANRGYLSHYFEHRHIMRCFIEAAAINPRFRSLWWSMRERHVQRFATAVRAIGPREPIDRLGVEATAEAMACMVEQCAYVWFAHRDRDQRLVDVDQATEVVTFAWHSTFFGQAPEPAGAAG